MFSLGFGVLKFLFESERKVIVSSLLHPLIWNISVMYGVCRPLKEESSFCLGLSTRPVSEVVPEGLIPRFLDLITLL